MTPAEERLSTAEAAVDRARAAYYAAKDERTAARDALRAERREGRATGGVAFGSGGFVADEVFGGIIATGRHTTVIGMQVTNGNVKTCRVCGGTRGWLIQDGTETHTGCGAEQ